jgi:DNA-binding NarL/FixJ family response regulator
LAEQGKPALAVEIYVLAQCYPFVANSRWCEDVAGHELTAIAEALPVEIRTAARARGQARDLWSTVAALLAELDHVENKDLPGPPTLPVGRAPVAPIPPTYPAGLTAREVEVLRLLAQGLTYAQIADKLIISRRTVNGHVTSIYSKLGVTTRATATRFAVEHNLV